jgi:hypothetical protein
MKTIITIALILIITGCAVFAQTSRPASQPASVPSDIVNLKNLKIN